MVSEETVVNEEVVTAKETVVSKESAVMEAAIVKCKTTTASAREMRSASHGKAHAATISGLRRLGWKQTLGLRQEVGKMGFHLATIRGCAGQEAKFIGRFVEFRSGRSTVS